MDAVKEILKTFEDLVRRMLAPSMTLFAMLAVVHAVHYLFLAGLDTDWGYFPKVHYYAPGPYAGIAKFFMFLKTNGPSSFLVALTCLVCMVGISYFLFTLQTLLFDNNLRTSFTPQSKKDKDPLKSLRAEVKVKFNRLKIFRNPAQALPKDDWKDYDYFLYEIIGGIDQGSTRPFVDDAKAYGIVCISFSLSLFSLLLFYLGLKYIPIWIIIVCASGFVLRIGFGMVRAQYRARSVRHYMNFLMMPDQKIKAILGTHDKYVYYDEIYPPARVSATPDSSEDT